MKLNTSFCPLGRVIDWETPSCVCWEDVFRSVDEIIYEWVPVRRLSVVNFSHLVLVRITTHQKSPIIHTNALSDALLMSGFQIFVADAKIENRAIENRASHGFFWTDSVNKSAQLIPDSCQKEWTTIRGNNNYDSGNSWISDALVSRRKKGKGMGLNRDERSTQRHKVTGDVSEERTWHRREVRESLLKINLIKRSKKHRIRQISRSQLEGSPDT